jgi:cell division protein FtsB
MNVKKIIVELQDEITRLRAQDRRHTAEIAELKSTVAALRKKARAREAFVAQLRARANRGR